jgi:hypothetical protein
VRLSRLFHTAGAEEGMVVDSMVRVSHSSVWQTKPFCTPSGERTYTWPNSEKINMLSHRSLLLVSKRS